MQDLSFGKRISVLRRQAGFSIDKLSSLTSYDACFIEGVEKGEIFPSIADVKELARAFHVHPAAILDGHEKHENHELVDFVAQYLPEFLRETRFKRNLTLDEASKSLGVTEAELSAWESGSTLPDDKKISSLAILYGIDEKLVRELCAAEKSLPMACGRLAKLERLFRRFIAVLNDVSADREKLLDCLSSDIQSCLAGTSGICEREASYFSIGHLSDNLLKALQYKEFHQEAEEMAGRFLAVKSKKVTPDGEAEENQGDAIS